MAVGTAVDGSAAEAPPTGAAVALQSIADRLLADLEERSPYVRLRRHLSADPLPEITAAAAERDGNTYRELLQELDKIDYHALTHEEQLFRGVLRHELAAGSSAREDYWFQFGVTPYSGGYFLQSVQDLILSSPVSTRKERQQYLDVLDQYATLVEQLGKKTREQADRGIFLPRPALAGARKTLEQISLATTTALMPTEPELQTTSQPERTEFAESVKTRIAQRIQPAFQSLLKVLGPDYEKRAPLSVGMSQYPQGSDYYLRRIHAETGSTLTPAAIHALGLTRVTELESQMKRIREQLGFHGSQLEFHAKLRADPRFTAQTPDDVQRKYQAALSRLVPELPRWFTVLPKTPYIIERLPPAAEAGMTFGYYDPPHPPQEPDGVYRFNGSNLSARPTLWSAHLIYHELMPGHHLRLSLGIERHGTHPILQFLSNSAFEEGWAEYAANLGLEMGAYQDPYDFYGHLISQDFLASRLVVDTGLNALGWSLEQAQEYLSNHSFSTPAESATEVVRYSTDIPAQALAYRMGYESFIRGRERAERALGPQFNVAEFDTTVSNHGALPPEVLDREVTFYIQSVRHR